MHVKKETFIVTVNIIEGRHFAWPNMDSVVQVQVGNQKKCTSVKYNTDCPYFNEYFLFEFTTNLQELEDKIISFTVMQPRNFWRKRKTLGYVSLDVGTVWTQTDHQFFHKWAILTSPDSEVMTGPKGYLKVDIRVLGKGDIPKEPADYKEEHDEIEGNLLLPEGITTERQWADYIFKIYRGENLYKGTMKNSLEPLSSSIEICFAGLKGKTSIKKSTANPTWNESLVLSELFPPLCQRIKIYLLNADVLCHKIMAVHFINLSLISNDGEDGFLPTYGPTFVHFYSYTNCGEVYAGRVLMSMHTELRNSLSGNKKAVFLETISPLDEVTLLRHEKVLVFASVFNVIMIDKRYDKSISFEMHFGEEQTTSLSKEAGENVAINFTFPQPPLKGKFYLHLNYKYEKPCITLLSRWPDFRRRIFNANIIEKITCELKDKLDLIELLFLKNEYISSCQDIEYKMIDMFDSLSSACSKCVDIISTKDINQGTSLDKGRLKLCIKELTEISKSCKTIYNPRTKKKCFRKAQKLFKRIKLLTENPQGCWPDVYIWMLSGGKKIAVYRTSASDVAYSIVEEEAGKNCSKPQIAFFQSCCTKKHISNIASAVEIFLWVGLERHKNDCFTHIPEGFHMPQNLVPGTIPQYIVTDESHCRAHIYQGRFNPGSDESGLCDPLVRITIDEITKQTKVQKKTLQPVWDQTLIFKTIILYGDKNFIKNNPPLALLEVFDQDEYSKLEYLGHVNIKPVVKLANETYTAPLFPPKLKWYKIICNEEEIGSILATVELLELLADVEGDEVKDSKKIIAIPNDIRPNMIEYKLEVLFWGVRELKKVGMLQVSKPQMMIECSYSVLYSDTILNANRNLNFAHLIKCIELILPDQEEYAPPLCLKMYDSRSFGRYTLVGIHMVPVQRLFYHPLTKQEREQKISGYGMKSYDSLDSKQASTPYLVTKENVDIKKNKFVKVCYRDDIKRKLLYDGKRCIMKLLSYKKRSLQNTPSQKPENKTVKNYKVDTENLDWWIKYFASYEDDVANKNNVTKTSSRNIFRVKIYSSELESQPEFNGFTDILTSFCLYKGKRTGDETVDEDNITGIFKGAIRIYRWPPSSNLEYVTENGSLLRNGAFQDIPSNDQLKFLVRVYCVKAIGLTPKDLSGKADPYICVTLNDVVICDQNNYVPRQVNPIFGRCFELNGIFPRDHLITISIWDYDLGTKDDLIGETKIDIENRFYTRHRAACGLATEYIKVGYCAWRDLQRPTQILEELCQKLKLPSPEYTEHSVKIGFKTFQPVLTAQKSEQTNNATCKESLALLALRRWHEYPNVGCHLVPEHVETRSLYNPSKPGIEQGKLQLWVDIFPYTEKPMPKAVDISPRKPVSYELRVIIWNTEDIVLEEDDFFSGDKRSDIYIKGWLTSPDECQYTDVHYRSLTGEGNFNWRFVFKFEYISVENKLVIRKKENLFAIDETEFKIPCKLTLQVWDNDTLATDDFLGSLYLELSRLPRGAKFPKKCNLNIVLSNAPVINLFKTKRTKGWWPFIGVNKDTNEDVLAGKVEIEFQLLTAEEAEKSPVGLGREDPQALPKPKYSIRF